MTPPTDSRPIPGWNGYRVDPRGNVYSCRTNNGREGHSWRRRAAPLNLDGYPQVHLTTPKLSRLVRVHTLVLLAFVGPRPEGMECCHRNGVRTDNRLENLYWGTSRENKRDRDRHGRTARGSHNGNAKASPAVIVRIREMRSSGLAFSAIGAAVGLSKRQVGRILSGRHWRGLFEAPRDVIISRDELLPQPPDAKGA